jgi:hypothetical protein
MLAKLVAFWGPQLTVASIFGEATRRRMGGLFRLEVQSLNHKSLLILGLITIIPAQRTDGFDEAGGARRIRTSGTGHHRRSVGFPQALCFRTPQSDAFALLVGVQKFYTRLDERFLDRQHRADPRVHPAFFKPCKGI